MNIWRIHLKASAERGIDQRKLCLENGFVGVGWQINSESNNISKEEYWEKGEIKYGDSSWKSAINAMINKVRINDLIWTRDWNGIYYLGRITSDWYYNKSSENTSADIVNVRNCDWVKIGTEEAVPGRVVNGFRGSRALQRCLGKEVNQYSQFIYDKRNGGNFYSSKIDDLQDNIFNLISAEDCEDVVGLYLQAKHNYILIPSSCKKDTLNHEYELKNKRDGHNAVVQVKSGKTPIYVESYLELSKSKKVYLFAVSENYIGKSTSSNIITLSNKEIERFLLDYTNLLPEKIQHWIELSKI